SLSRTEGDCEGSHIHLGTSLPSFFSLGNFDKGRKSSVDVLGRLKVGIWKDFLRYEYLLRTFYAAWLHSTSYFIAQHIPGIFHRTLYSFLSSLISIKTRFGHQENL